MFEQLRQRIVDFLQPSEKVVDNAVASAPPEVPPANDPPPPSQPTAAEQREKVLASIQLEKQAATAAGQAWVKILNFELDTQSIHSGAFELDWNDLWVAKLIKAGYRIKETDTDNEIVDRWFTDVCRNVVREIYEQEQADPTKREVVYREQLVVGSKNLGEGRREVS